MKNLRVAIDYRPALLLKSGIGRYVRELARELKKLENLDLVLFASFWRGQREALEAASRTDPGWDEGVEVVAKKIPAGLYNRIGSSCGFGIEKLLPQVDLFHHTDYLATPFFGAPEIATIYDLSFMAAQDFHEPGDTQKLKAVSAYLAQRAQGILTISTVSRDDIVAHLKVDSNKISVTPLAAAAVFHEVQKKRAAIRAQNSERDTFLVLGTLEPRKNHLRILAAFDQLLEDPAYANAKMVWIGRRGWCTDEVINRLAQAKYKGRVTWLGEVSDHKLDKIMVEARAMLYPSLMEGFGLPLIEALAAGMPLLTSNRGAMAELVGDAAILVDPENVAELAQGIKLLWDSHETCSSLAAQARKRAQEFSWARCAEQTLAAYRRASDESVSS